MKIVGREKDQIIVETDPIRDCTGNAVPDGTIVTFTETDSTGRSVVDARIKKGIARAQLPASNKATIAVASGVVLGKELHVGGGQ
jgi:phosphopantetheine adenylyltransferase